MKYIPNNLMHELYDQVFNIEENKYSLKNRYFSLPIFLKKMIEKTVIDEFEKFIEKKFEEFGSNCMQNYDGFWMNALFNSDCSNKSNVTINDLIKFDKDFTSYSMVITVELFYNKIESDIYFLLINRLHTKRIIIKFEQRCFWINNNIIPIVYSDDDEWSSDMNRVVNVSLNCVNLMPNLQSLCIIADKNCDFVLDEKNSELVSSILNNSSKTLELLTLTRINLIQSCQNKIIESVFKLEKLKFLLFKAAKLNLDMIEKIKSYYKNKNKNFCYIRFSKKCVIATE
jgi:hypothetical protein